jgi:hypothetical protein
MARLRERYEDVDATGWDIFDFAYAKGSPFVALWYSRLFWPDFVELDGIVFLKELVGTGEGRLQIQTLLSTHGGDRRRVEQSMNVYPID